MNITPIKDFLYSLDGIRPTSFKKGVGADVPESVGKKLKLAVGYIEGGAKGEHKLPIEPSDPNSDKTGPSDPIPFDQIEGMKSSYIKVLVEAGYDSIEKLKGVTEKELADLDGISKNGAKGLIEGLAKV